MLIENSKNLEFRCGPYGLLIDITNISAIVDQGEDFHINQKNSIGGKTALWNDTEILFIDLRIALDIEESKIENPLHFLVLKNANTDKPYIMVAVDQVSHIVEIQESQWYELNGINPKLDIFFDRAYPDKESGQIFMRLAHAEQWATNQSGVDNAY